MLTRDLFAVADLLVPLVSVQYINPSIFRAHVLNIGHADAYKFSFFPCTVREWNSLTPFAVKPDNHTFLLN